MSAEWTIPEPPTRRRGWLIALGVLGGLAVLGVIAAIVIGVAVSRAYDREVDKAEKTCAGFAYRGRETLDHCAGMGGPVRDFGQTLTVRNLRRVAASGSGPPHICADVTYVNRTGERKYFSEYDWRLGDPGGTLHDADVEASSLGEGEMASGGTTSGNVCFEDVGERGQLAVIWDPDETRGDRGVWLGTL